MWDLWDVANDPEVRCNSFNKNKIEMDDHRIWVQKKCKDKNCLFLAVEINGKFGGSVRFDIEKNDKAIINISLHKSFRGKGLSVDMIKKAIKLLFLLHPEAKTVIAQIFPENIPSIKAFEQAGFNYCKDEIIKDCKVKIFYKQVKN